MHPRNDEIPIFNFESHPTGYNARMSVPKARDVKLTSHREKVILVGGYRAGDLLPGEAPLEELERLAETAGAVVVAKVVQNIKEVTPATFIGKGKVQEVKELFYDCDADTLLVKVNQIGGAACHEGYQSCFFRKLSADGRSFSIVGERLFDPAEVYKKKS